MDGLEVRQVVKLLKGREVHEPGGGEGEQVRNHGAGGLFVGEGQGEAHCQSVDHASVHEPKGVGLQLHGCDVRPAAKARAAAEQQEDEGDAQRKDLPRRPPDALVAVERALLAARRLFKGRRKIERLSIAPQTPLHSYLLS